MLAQKLRQNAAPTFNPMRKSMPAGMPTSFASHATVRNQFSRVMNRPRLANNVSRDSSPPYGRGSEGDEKSPERPTALVVSKSSYLATVNNKNTTPFNRFASDKSFKHS